MPKLIIILSYPRIGSSYITWAMDRIFNAVSTKELFTTHMSSFFFPIINGHSGWTAKDLDELAKGRLWDGTKYRKSDKPICIKIMTKHIHLLGDVYFRRLVTDPANFVICNYRKDYADTVLSHIIARYTQAWNYRQYDELAEKPKTIDLTNRRSMVWETFYKVSQSLRELQYWSDEITYDKVYAYEDLVGDPAIDFEDIVKQYDIEGTNWLNIDHKKILTFDDKLSMLSDKDLFWEMLDGCLQHTGYQRYNTIKARVKGDYLI